MHESNPDKLTASYIPHKIKVPLLNPRNSHSDKGVVARNAVDMLQGRCPQSVLVRHYQTPESNLSSRILDSLDSLYRAIEQ
jgi:hypothetical protein